MTSKKKDDKKATASKTEEHQKENVNLEDKIVETDKEQKLTMEEAAELEEFNKALKKYHKISRDIRMSALLEEKKELEKMIKSPAKKYFEGSREDRLQALEEEKELMEKINDISKNKN